MQPPGSVVPKEAITNHAIVEKPRMEVNTIPGNFEGGD